MPPRKKKDVEAEAPTQEAPDPGTPEPETEPWPLLKREYLAPRSLSRNAVHEGQVVRDLRHRLGLPPAGVFDDEVREAVLAFQRDAGRPQTGVVAPEDWDALFAAPAAPVGED